MITYRGDWTGFVSATETEENLAVGEEEPDIVDGKRTRRDKNKDRKTSQKDKDKNSSKTRRSSTKKGNTRGGRR